MAWKRNRLRCYYVLKLIIIIATTTTTTIIIIMNGVGVELLGKKNCMGHLLSFSKRFK